MDIEDLPDLGVIINDTDNGTGAKELTRYNYDRYNRLTGMKNEKTTAAYEYNAQGYRVEKTVNGDTTNYLYNADKVVLETDATGNQTAFQAYGSALLYRSVTGAPETSAGNYYYLYNAHGDVTSLIDNVGGIAATYDYDAFGNVIDKTGNVDNHITYAGYQSDDESGLYYLNARYYDSEIARFITEDDSKYSKMSDPLSLNLYVYCQNDPILYSDPAGHVIILSGTKNEKDKILANLQLLTDNVLAYDKNGKVYISEDAERQDVIYPEGNALIINLLQSNYVCTIQISPAKESATAPDPENRNNAYNGIGCDATIYLDDSNIQNLTVVPGKGFLTPTDTPLYIVLAHELIHAYRDMKGIAIPNSKTDTVTIRIAKHGIFGYGKAKPHTYIVPWDEEATIGLGHNKKMI